MKAKLYKVLDQYHLYDGDKAIATTIVGNPMLLPNLSLKNCDEIFGVVDIEKLAQMDIHNVKPINPHPHSYFSGFIRGFNKAMKLNKDKVFTRENMIWARDSGYTNFMTEEMFFDKLDMHNQQPTEIEVEIVMESIGIGDKYTPDPKPKLDSEGCLILKKI